MAYARFCPEPLSTAAERQTKLRDVPCTLCDYNFISFRRRERMKSLERECHELSLLIKDAKREVDELKKVFLEFAEHAADCERCGDLKIKFER